MTDTTPQYPEDLATWAADELLSEAETNHDADAMGRLEQRVMQYHQSEPHRVSDPVSTQHILSLLERSDPYSLGELQRLAIGFRLATMETDAEAVRRRMRRFINECDCRTTGENR